MSTDEEPADENFLVALHEALLTLDWYPVAEKEFRDSVRSLGLWFLAVVFTVFFVAPPAAALYFGVEFGQGFQEFGMQILLSQVYTQIVTWFLPIVAIFVGYGAISKERESGSIKLLLSLPHSRRDVVIGKVLGRCAVVAIPLTFGLALNAIFLVFTELTFKPELYFLFAVTSIAFALVIVAIAVSISGAMPNSNFSIMANVLFYLYITLIWNSMANSIGDALRDTVNVSLAGSFSFVLLVKLLNPSQAYKTLTSSLLNPTSDGPRAARYGMFSQGNSSHMETICADVLNGNATTVQSLFGSSVQCGPTDQGIPLWFSDPAVFVFFALWIGVAAAISYYTFDQVDL